jgi:thermolysin
MKKLFSVLLFVLFLVALVEGAYVGKVYFKSQEFGQPGNVLGLQGEAVRALIEREIRRGNLRLFRIQDDPIASMQHRRYQQYFKELEVFGGVIIKHYKGDELVGINGEYYLINEVDTTPSIPKEKAVAILKADLKRDDLRERSGETKLLIYPVKDGDYRLAYQIILEKGMEFSTTGIVDAQSGEVLCKYSNIHYTNHDELTIGLGIGYHGGRYKFPTTFSEGVYYLYDEKKVRPVNQYIYDFRTFDGFYYYVPADNDNYWDYDGAIVNAHAFLGLTYDYYYLVHGRQGIDGQNMDIEATVHWYEGFDNAKWDSIRRHIYFCDPGPNNWQTAAALDVVAHEYSHGVTQYSSALVYCFESGALNESFSDIMAAAVEFYWQPPGNGFNKADWVMGEDTYPFYHPNNYQRNLADPNAKGHPCHLWQKYELPLSIDNGGVHLNATIYSHAYYLLANGGTNRVSGIHVTGIGLEKATQIFYRAWVYYLFPTAEFLHAAVALTQSAYDLYGSGSQELAQTIRAMEAIGWQYTGATRLAH